MSIYDFYYAGYSMAKAGVDYRHLDKSHTRYETKLNGYCAGVVKLRKRRGIGNNNASYSFKNKYDDDLFNEVAVFGPNHGTVYLNRKERKYRVGVLEKGRDQYGNRNFYSHIYRHGSYAGLLPVLEEGRTVWKNSDQ